MKLHNISIEFLSCRESMGMYNAPPSYVYTTNKISPYFCLIQYLSEKMEVSRENREPLVLERNQCFIFPANSRQKIKFSDDTVFPCVDHAQYIFVDVVINGKCRMDDLFDFPEVLPEKYQPEIFLLLQELSKLNDSEETLCDRLSLTYKIIKILLNCAQPKKKLDTSLLIAIDYIKRNYRRNIHISELSEVANMSESNFFRVFKRTMGSSPTAYINDYRLLVASALLETTNKKIGSISESVGFNEQYYFSKLFSKKFGVSPAVYRKMHRQKADFS